MNRTILEDCWLRLLYVVDGVGQRHYEPVGFLFRAWDVVQVRRSAAGVGVEGYGMREVWRRLEGPHVGSCTEGAQSSASCQIDTLAKSPPAW